MKGFAQRRRKDIEIEWKWLNYIKVRIKAMEDTMNKNNHWRLRNTKVNSILKSNLLAHTERSVFLLFKNTCIDHLSDNILGLFSGLEFPLACCEFLFQFSDPVLLRLYCVHTLFLHLLELFNLGFGASSLTANLQ